MSSSCTWIWTHHYYEQHKDLPDLSGIRLTSLRSFYIMFFELTSVYFKWHAEDQIDGIEDNNRVLRNDSCMIQIEFSCNTHYCTRGFPFSSSGIYQINTKSRGLQNILNTHNLRKLSIFGRAPHQSRGAIGSHRSFWETTSSQSSRQPHSLGCMHKNCGTGDSLMKRTRHWPLPSSCESQLFRRHNFAVAAIHCTSTHFKSGRLR